MFFLQQKRHNMEKYLNKIKGIIEYKKMPQRMCSDIRGNCDENKWNVFF